MDNWDRERTESEKYAEELRKRIERKFKRFIQLVGEAADAARAKMVETETNMVQ